MIDLGLPEQNDLEDRVTRLEEMVRLLTDIVEANEILKRSAGVRLMEKLREQVDSKISQSYEVSAGADSHDVIELPKPL